MNRNPQKKQLQKIHKSIFIRKFAITDAQENQWKRYQGISAKIFCTINHIFPHFCSLHIKRQDFLSKELPSTDFCMVPHNYIWKKIRERIFERKSDKKIFERKSMENIWAKISFEKKKTRMLLLLLVKLWVTVPSERIPELQLNFCVVPQNMNRNHLK